MPLSLLPSEVMLHESSHVLRGGFLWSRSVTTRIQLTNQRLSGTYEYRQFGSTFLGGGEFTKYMPLEIIEFMWEGSESSPLWALAAVVLGILGVLFTITLIGAVVGVPMIILAAICLFVFLLRRREGVYFSTGGDEKIEVLLRDRSGVENLVNMVESARIERVHFLSDK